MKRDTQPQSLAKSLQVPVVQSAETVGGPHHMLQHHFPGEKAVIARRQVMQEVNIGICCYLHVAMPL